MANAYDRLTVVSVGNVLPYIGGGKREYAGTMVKMGSQRYQVFNKSLACASCELVGSFFALERDKAAAKRDGPYHFNLYALRPDGSEVLMTKDHIVPKSKGGKDHLSNYVTMCAPCNNKKAAKVPEEPKEVFVVRHFYEDCNDMSYIGVYDDFWKALAASIADSKDNHGTPGHSFAVSEPSPHSDSELWCEVLFNGRALGIYYTINRMELQ
jgi:hypothetical protein